MISDEWSILKNVIDVGGEECDEGNESQSDEDGTASVRAVPRRAAWNAFRCVRMCWSEDSSHAPAP